MLHARTWVLTKACWCECNLGSLLGLIVFFVLKGFIFGAKCHQYVLGMMNELVVLITKDNLLHLDFKLLSLVQIGQEFEDSDQDVGFDRISYLI